MCLKQNDVQLGERGWCSPCLQQCGLCLLLGGRTQPALQGELAAGGDRMGQEGGRRRRGCRSKEVVLGQQDCCSEVVSVHQVMKPRREETEDRGEVGEVLVQSFCQTMRTFFSYLHVYVLQPSGGSALQDKLGGGCQPW